MPQARPARQRVRFRYGTGSVVELELPAGARLLRLHPLALSPEAAA